MVPSGPGHRVGNLAAAAHRCLATARMEIRLNLGTPAPWVMGLVLGALGYLTARTQPEPSSFPIGWDLAHQVAPLAAILLLFLAASLAHRPVRYEVTEITDSKLTGSEEIILGRWVGMVAAVLVPLLLEYAAAMAGQKIHAKPPVQLEVYLLSFVRGLPPVLFLTTLAFCLVVLTRVLVLGAGLAGLLWFALYSGRSLYPSAFRIDLSQNAGLFLGLTLAALLAMLLGYQGRRRAKRAPATMTLAAFLALCTAGTAVYAGWLALAMPGKAVAAASWKRLGSRHRRGAPVPNFAWVDTRGRRLSLATQRGRPLLVVFFQPKDGGLPALLTRLSGLPAHFAEDELRVVGVCLSEDLNGAADVSRFARVEFPVVTDWGGPSIGEFNAREPHSALAWSLRINTTPHSLLLDEDGREIARGLPLDERSWENLKLEIRRALDGETDPAAAIPGDLPGGMPPASETPPPSPSGSAPPGATP